MSDREALAKLVYEAVRFAIWAAGEGLAPAPGQPADDPEDFLFDYAKAADIDDWDGLPAVARNAIVPAQGALKLGDMVQVNERAPFFSDWRDATMKVVSLRIDPEGKQWVSVIEGKPHHRGNGVYDGETTDFDAEYLSAFPSTEEKSP